MFTQQTFQEWRAHPLTAEFRQYLQDNREVLKEQWAQGQPLDLKHQTKALLMGELASLEWRDLAEFYGLTPEE